MIENLQYHLPKEKIAQKPSIPRDKCNLLVLRKERIEHRKFYEIVDYLEEKDVIILNNTKVIKTRVIGRKNTGGKLDILIIDGENGVFECLIKGKYREGTVFSLGGKKGEIIEKKEGKCKIKIPLNIEEIKKIGKMPVPPYIKGEVKDEWYQTIFAYKEGSIAAPTAGLHFTKKLIKKIRDKGVTVVFATLHVGLATFMSPDKIKDAKEYYCVDKETADAINNSSGKIIGVGTTVVKAIESSSCNGITRPSQGWSNLFISPGYQFQSRLNGMLTNFHMPSSSPLMLTAAFAGVERIMRAYEEALERDYRFLSFGDAMLILNV
ncbi:MAG TPA: tRNA preQ1(34) S-adenosylmethionine ribosyltransferase-isomerase QueA [Thermoplasmata archaeon]|nr:tRNA preQ1(34) S-adenosylmethionine ribosyltransferase-isomerase QueA [Thermoplasmata archaeon]